MSETIHSVENRLAIVTGASRGIGKAIALELATNGAIVAGTAKTPEGLRAIEEMLKEVEAEGFAIPLDLAETETMRASLKHLVEAAGKPVSILVNNAGITADGLAMGMKESWDKVIDTNLTGTFRVTQTVGLGMIKGVKRGELDRADIMTIGSVVGEIGEPGQVNYAASKAGLIAVTKTLAREWPEVSVNILNPGYVETDMTSELSPERIAEILALTDSGKAMTPEYVAEIVQDVIESGKTGQVITLDDGISKNLQAQGIIS